jgi:hypothetical protein
MEVVEVVPDSGLMVLLWRLLRHEKIRRISGLKYVQQLLHTIQLNIVAFSRMSPQIISFPVGA